MKSFLKAATLCQAALAAAFFIPPTSDDIVAVAGSIGPDHTSIQFSSLLPGSQANNEDFLDLEFSIFAATEECTFRGFSLNGLPLDSGTGKRFAHNTGYFNARRSQVPGDYQILATWQATCLGGEATLLSFDIHGLAILTDDEAEPTGFTVSFKQAGPEPQIFRLQTKPKARDLLSAWTHTVGDQHMTILSPGSGSALPLEREYQTLEWLKGQLYELQERVHHQEGRIWRMLKQEFKTCDSMKCLLRTAVTKLPDIANLIKSHFRHHPEPASWQQDPLHLNCSRDSSPDDQVFHDEWEADFETLPSPDGEDAQPLPYIEAVEHEGPAENPKPVEARPPPEAEHPHPPFSEPPGVDKDHPHPPFGKDHPPFDRPPFGKDHPPFHGPPFGKGHPPFDGLPFGKDNPPFDGPPFGREHPHPPFDGPAPNHPHGDHRPGHGPPPFLPHPHPYRFGIVKGVAAFIVIAIALCFVIRQIRIRVAHCRNARRSADRAARREERRNQRAYRSAARRHQWSQWWNRYRRPFGNADYDEKRGMILEQEGVLEDAMQNDIQSLRQAHEIVGDMMRAEEGRARLYYEANLPPSHRQPSAAELDAGVGSSRQLNSLPVYAVPPPRYEEELEGDISVVDGFRYTPSASEETPDSSVIDTSPRLSWETGRTTITKELRD